MKNLRKSKTDLTLRGVLPASILSLQAFFALKENIIFSKIHFNYFNMNQHFLLAFSWASLSTKFEYLRGNESFSITILASFQGPDELDSWRKNATKSRDPVPLMCFLEN